MKKLVIFVLLALFLEFALVAGADYPQTCSDAELADTNLNKIVPVSIDNTIGSSCFYASISKSISELEYWLDLECQGYKSGRLAGNSVKAWRIASLQTQVLASTEESGFFGAEGAKNWCGGTCVQCSGLALSWTREPECNYISNNAKDVAGGCVSPYYCDGKGNCISGKCTDPSKPKEMIYKYLDSNLNTKTNSICCASDAADYSYKFNTFKNQLDFSCCPAGKKRYEIGLLSEVNSPLITSGLAKAFCCNDIKQGIGFGPTGEFDCCDKFSGTHMVDGIGDTSIKFGVTPRSASFCCQEGVNELTYDSSGVPIGCKPKTVCGNSIIEAGEICDIKGCNTGYKCNSQCNKCEIIQATPPITPPPQEQPEEECVNYCRKKIDDGKCCSQPLKNKNWFQRIFFTGSATLQVAPAVHQAICRAGKCQIVCEEGWVDINDINGEKGDGKIDIKDFECLDGVMAHKIRVGYQGKMLIVYGAKKIKSKEKTIFQFWKVSGSEGKGKALVGEYQTGFIDPKTKKCEQKETVLKDFVYDIWVDDIEDSKTNSAIYISSTEEDQKLINQGIPTLKLRAKTRCAKFKETMVGDLQDTAPFNYASTSITGRAISEVEGTNIFSEIADFFRNLFS